MFHRHHILNNSKPILPGPHPAVQWQSAAGFSLIEMAIILVVFAMVLSGGIKAMHTQNQKNNFEKAQSEMRAIQDALLGFLTVNGRLPCPDTDFDGMEQANCANPNQEGQLPWNSLGVKPLDPWGHLYTYRVTPTYAVSITGAGIGEITIQNNAGVELVDEIPVIILSRGKNGLGGRSMTGTAMPVPTLISELANTTTDGIFQLGAGDDLLIWLAPDVVKHHALKSGYSL